jgi:hypothetical protein
MEELIKEQKLWEVGSLTNSFGFLRFTVVSKNQSFDFLKIADQGSIILRAYLLILSLKKKG